MLMNYEIQVRASDKMDNVRHVSKDSKNTGLVKPQKNIIEDIELLPILHQVAKDCSKEAPVAASPRASI